MKTTIYTVWIDPAPVNLGLARPTLRVATELARQLLLDFHEQEHPDHRVKRVAHIRAVRVEGRSNELLAQAYNRRLPEGELVKTVQIPTEKPFSAR